MICPVTLLSQSANPLTYLLTYYLATALRQVEWRKRRRHQENEGVDKSSGAHNDCTAGCFNSGFFFPKISENLNQNVFETFFSIGGPQERLDTQ